MEDTSFPILATPDAAGGLSMTEDRSGFVYNKILLLQGAQAEVHIVELQWKLGVEPTPIDRTALFECQGTRQ
jgi:hypothetical protein